MAIDHIYRYIFIFLLCSLTGIRVYFKWLSGVLFESPFQKEPWYTILLRYLAGAPLFVMVFLCIIFPKELPWSYLTIPAWMRLLGLVLSVGGLALLVCAHKALDGYFSMTLILKKEHQLIKQGPYRWIRHPIYMGYLVFFFGLSLVIHNWIIGLSGLLVMFTLIIIRLPLEENRLRERFGEEYDLYAMSTGRFVPLVKTMPSLHRSGLRLGEIKHKSNFYKK